VPRGPFLHEALHLGDARARDLEGSSSVRQLLGRGHGCSSVLKHEELHLGVAPAGGIDVLLLANEDPAGTSSVFFFLETLASLAKKLDFARPGPVV
jgi:hypothetical protein